MPIVKVRLEGPRNKILWEKALELSESGQVSIGKSSVCDVRCESFSTTEWALLTLKNGFISVDDRSSTSFGYLSVVHPYRRGRRLFCSFVPSEGSVVLDVARGLDFSESFVLQCLPSSEAYHDPDFRFLAADILMRDDIFESWRDARGGQSISFGTLVELVRLRVERIAPASMMPLDRIQRFIDCVFLISSYLYAEGPLTSVLRRENVREVMFNGHKECWVEQEEGLMGIPSPFTSWDDLRAWLLHHSSAAGRELETSRGCSDFALASGPRVHVALAPIAREEGYVSIRCHRDQLCSLEALVKQGTVTEEQRRTLLDWVKSKKNILLAGATSSGKTTLLRALAECVDAQERIVILEDVPEIRLNHKNCVYLKTFEGDIDASHGSISLDDLLREALRMRPDRLIVGECRGREAFALIQALHTGHRGSFSTLHANSPQDALRRLEALLVRAEPSLSTSVVRHLILRAFDAVVFLERDSQLKRRVSAMHLTEDLP